MENRAYSPNELALKAAVFTNQLHRAVLPALLLIGKNFGAFLPHFIASPKPEEWSRRQRRALRSVFILRSAYSAVIAATKAGRRLEAGTENGPQSKEGCSQQKLRFWDGLWLRTCKKIILGFPI